MNNKDDSVRIYSIFWSQLYLFLNSTFQLTHQLQWNWTSLYDLHSNPTMVCGLYLNSYCVCTFAYKHSLICPRTYKSTCHFIRTLRITLSKVEKYNERASEDFYRSANLKGSWYPQTTVSKAKKDTVPRCCPRFQKCVPAKSPLTARVEQASCSTPSQGQHVVKCILNPRIGRVKSPLSLAICSGGLGGRGFNCLMHKFCSQY